MSPAEIASTGHSSIHVPQAVQSVLILYAIFKKFWLTVTANVAIKQVKSKFYKKKSFEMPKL